MSDLFTAFEMVEARKAAARGASYDERVPGTLTESSEETERRLFVGLGLDVDEVMELLNLLVPQYLASMTVDAVGVLAGAIQDALMCGLLLAQMRAEREARERNEEVSP